MKSDALKSDLIRWIQQIQDVSILNAISTLRQSFEKGDWFDSLSEAQKESIQRGMKETEEGKVYSSKEFWAMYEKRM